LNGIKLHFLAKSLLYVLDVLLIHGICAHIFTTDMLPHPTSRVDRGRLV
jgi:hypothetical protein